jgi:hypothetical protein
MKSRSHSLKVIPPFNGIASDVNGAQVDESEIGLYSKNHEEIGGESLSDLRYDPRKRLVLRVESKNACGDTAVVYRKFRGTSVDKSSALLGVMTFSALRSVHGSSLLDFNVCVRPMPLLRGRLLFYWNHPDDAARVSFKLGMVGLLLGLASLFVDSADIHHFFSFLFVS